MVDLMRGDAMDNLNVLFVVEVGGFCDGHGVGAQVEVDDFSLVLVLRDTGRVLGQERSPGAAAQVSLLLELGCGGGLDVCVFGALHHALWEAIDEAGVGGVVLADEGECLGGTVERDDGDDGERVVAPYAAPYVERERLTSRGADGARVDAGVTVVHHLLRHNGKALVTAREGGE